MLTKRALSKGASYGLAGERGLLAKVIADARADALGLHGANYIANAWGYFAGDDYQHHLAWLGLPGEWRPEAIEGLSFDELGELVEVVMKED